VKPLPLPIRALSLKALPPKGRLALRWVGYVAAYLTVLVLFFYLTFPFEQLKRRIITAYAGTLSSPANGHLEIDDLSWSWAFPGVVAHGVRMVSIEPATTSDSEAKTKVITLERLAARFSPLMWLFGTNEVSFSATGMGGDVNGSFSSSSKGREYTVELHDVSPGQLPMIAQTIGLPLAGTVNGEVQLVLPEGKAAMAQGDVSFTMDNLEIGDGKAKIRNTLALPTAQVGKLELKASITSGQLKLDLLKAAGPDLALEGEGKVRLNDKLQQSTADLVVSFGFTDRYRMKSDVTKALLGEPGSAVPSLFDMDPTLKRAKRPDGSYNFLMTGTLDRLHFIPTTQSVGSQRNAPTSPAATRKTPSPSKSKRPRSLRPASGAADAG
jgi:type II secretion system protein N